MDEDHDEVLLAELGGEVAAFEVAEHRVLARHDEAGRLADARRRAAEHLVEGLAARRVPAARRAGDSRIAHSFALSLS